MKKSKKILITLIVLVLLLIIGMLVYMFFFKTDENEVKEIIKDNNDNEIDTKLNAEWTEQSIGENI